MKRTTITRIAATTQKKVPMIGNTTMNAKPVSIERASCVPATAYAKVHMRAATKGAARIGFRARSRASS